MQITPAIVRHTDATGVAPDRACLDIMKCEFVGFSPLEINSGNCDEFAELLYIKIGGSLRETVLEGGAPTHVWVELDGLHFDAESPCGVNDWRDLAIFKRHMALVTEKPIGRPMIVDDGVSKINMHPIITQVLVECGWTAYSGPAIGVKFFVTAVGIKQAEAYLSKGDEFNRTLSGEYQSEGRNAMSASGVLIPVNADAGMVRRLAQQFAKQVDSAVAESYAARLHKTTLVTKL